MNFRQHRVLPVRKIYSQITLVQLCGVALETNLSNSVQNSFTHFAAKWGILTLSIREAAIPNDTAYWFFYFSFTPFILWNDRKHPVSVPPRRQGVFLSETGFSAVHKPFKFCSKFVHTFWSKVRYTNIVDKGSRNPESIVIYNLLFLFYPLYFVKWSKTPRFRHGAGVFSCLGVSLKWLSRVLVYIVKNISRSVHDLFTIKGRLRDIL